MPRLTKATYEYDSYEEYLKHRRELKSKGFYFVYCQEKYNRLKSLIFEAEYVCVEGGKEG